MNDLRTLRYDEKDGVATVTLSRPGGNRINVQMVKELTAVCDHLEDASQARVVVFRGDGGVFSEGMDFGDWNPREALDIHGFNRWEKCCTRLERLPKATIALVDGPAVGGGFQIALVCDLRVGTTRATFQLPEVQLGFLPGMGTFRLAKYVGLGHAKRIALTSPVISAQEAGFMGILDAVNDDLDAAQAEMIAALGPNHSVAIELTRRLLNESYSTSYENALGHFLAAQHRAITQTAFLDTLSRAKKGEPG
ncbi:MAG: enoyl-CoA hydratase/isomerase family protein [Deltaproteobacteria bacterium]|nr:enoyl-CoA hydratase/isomerase family protein [Deltaproteobacteria bacterium]